MPQASLRKIVLSIFLHPLLEKKKHLSILVFSLLLLAVSQSLFLLLLGPFLKTMFSLNGEASLVHGAAFLSPRMQSLFPAISRMTFEKHQMIMIVPGLLVLAALSKNIASYLYQVHSSYFGLLVAKRFRDKLFTAILNQPFRQISLRSPAEWMSILMNDVMFLQNKFSDIANGVIRDSIMTLAAFTTLVFVHWPTALGFMILGPFIAWGVGRTGKKISNFTDAVQEKLGQLADLVLEFRKRFEFIKAHNAEDYERRRFQTINTEYYRTIRKSIFVRSIFAPLLEFLSFASFAVILLFLSRGGVSKHFSPTDMIIFLAALGAMMRPLRQIGEQLTQFHETRGALRKSFLLLLKLEESQQNLSQPKRSVSSLSDSIDVHKLSSGFGSNTMIEAGPLKIHRGKSIAIIGPSGGGKSTLVRTLSGLLECVEWDATLPHETLAFQTSFVSQLPFLFDDSVLGNLTYGLDSDLNVQEIESCFDLVGIYDEIKQFSRGVDTNVKAISSNISGGQKQRLVLVRALLRGKSILLLDEATSSVDPRMEEEIVDKVLLWGQTHSKTIISVTHRLGMLQKYDEIWFVENGKVSASGNFSELMLQPRFKTFYDASL